MRAAQLLTLGALVLVGLIWIVSRDDSGASERGAGPDGSESLKPLGHVASDGVQSLGDSDRISQLERRMTEMAMTIEALRAELSRRQRAPAGVGQGEPTQPTGAQDPAWFLEQYVASFANGGSGSEYFRLAVAAYAPELVESIGMYVQRRGNPLLRTRLTELLGDPRLAGNPCALRPLYSALVEDTVREVPPAALAALRVVAREAERGALESRVWRVVDVHLRARFIELVLDLSGEHPNTTLARLFGQAPDPDVEVALVGQLRSHDIEGGVEFLGLASFATRAPRLAAAHRVKDLRGAAMIALVQRWLARETDEEIRTVLGASLEALNQVPRWAPEQATGRPDVPDITSDSQLAWASQLADAGPEWLEVGFEPALRAHAVEVHQVLAPGAIAEIILVATDGTRTSVWQGSDHDKRAGIWRTDFPTTKQPIRAVRVVLDTTRAAGWNEIDAVELIGPGARSFATSASASNYYRQSNRVRPTFNGLEFLSR